jgi:Mg-chelatase subunit ChlD
MTFDSPIVGHHRFGPGGGAASGTEAPPTQVSDSERLRRWRMVLGGADDGTGVRLSGDDARIDAALGAVYDTAPASRGGKRQGGLGASAPNVSRWLGDIRKFFPTSVVQVMQRDALERLNLKRLLLEPELLASVEPDIHLVATLLELSKLLPDTARATARQVVGQVVDQVEQRLAQRTRQAVIGALNRSQRSRRPRLPDVDWNRTIHANLRHYLPERRTIVPEKLVGYGRRQHSIDKEIVLAIDQSGSMAESVVYAGVFGSVLASIRAIRTQVVAFDTSVVDLTDRLNDPIDVLFGIQLGGGTDIDSAIAYCERLITRPADTVLILLSDLFEGGVRDGLEGRLAQLVRSGVTCVVLLALSDEGAPSFDRDHAAALASLGVPSFACTPDLFPDLIAAAIERRDLTRWAGAQGIVTTTPRSHS